MVFPIRAKNPPESFPFGTIALIAANIVVYALTTDTGLMVRASVVREWGLRGEDFGPIPMFTSMFLHGGIGHLLGNMWFLYLFGFAVEGRLKTPKFLVLYFASGAAGDVLHHVLLGRFHPEVPSIGASGAIMGVLGAGLYMFPFAQITVFYRFFIWGITDWPLWGVALLYLGFDALWAMLGAADGVGHLAHIGGAAGGALLAIALGTRRDTAQASSAKAMLADTKGLRFLTRNELAELARISPENTQVALMWMAKSLGDPTGPRPEAVSHFARLLPQIMEREEPVEVGHTLARLSVTPGAVAGSRLLEAATKLESRGEYQAALALYEGALRDPALPEADAEAALYRAGALYQDRLNSPQQAANLFLEVLRRFPFGGFAEHARERLRGLGYER
jgi:membrane associated rhomboid family serine protease